MLMVPQKWGPEDVLEARPVSPGLREETEISQGFSKLGARSLVRAAISRGLLSSRAALITASWMLCPLQSIFHVNYILCSRQKGGRVKGERTLSPLVAQTVENLPVLRETWVQSLGWEDPLEEGTAIHSSILAWIIPMDRGAWQAAVHGTTKSQI